MIQNKLKRGDVDVSLSSICRILKGIGISRQGGINGRGEAKKRSTSVKRTPEIKGYVTIESLMSHRDIKKETLKNKKKRKTNCRKLYKKRRAENRFDFDVTFDGVLG